jgi:hypothetical protein
MHPYGKTYKKRTESNDVTAILQYLQVLENGKYIFWCDRLNSGKIFIPAGMGRSARLVRLCREGTADIYFVSLKGLFVFVECKVGKNGLSPAQRKFRDMIQSAGHQYWESRDIRVFEQKVKELVGLE